MDTVQSFSVRGRTFVLPRERLGVEEVLDRDVDFFQVIHDFLHSPPRYLAVECENSEGAVPVLNFRIPAEWLEKEALFWQEQSFYQLFELEMAMWSAVLERLLKTYLSDQVFQSWPGRDRHQLWASLWLALRFLPERRYTPRELRAVVAASFAATQRLQLLSAVEAELRRRNFLEERSQRVSGSACPA
ncbi:unnamed protein product [Effrenium voratum]|uniref:Uncharacterized protein n=1 Tax=Effrenium voratum TaxID=2562239 RepID=A0AA36J3X3_9DINO|nr:unnamed protein product [Effrenium voratum]CAJ1398083.1 unnamed protein product [Effrenium voratum]